MLTAAHEQMDGRYVRWTIVEEIDAEQLRRARDIFDVYKMRGVILNDSFDDAVWRLSNQTKKVGLTLLPFEDGYHKNAMMWLGCEYRCYVDCVKAYIAFNLGEMNLASLQDITRAFVALARQTDEEIIAGNNCLNHIVGLLQLIPGGNEMRDYVIEELEEKLERQYRICRNGKQRQLADFTTYLKFNKIMGEFWQTANDRQRLFYFPLYFWWNLTAILPLRPMEFLLTPRRCLETGKNGESVLTIRRTKLKGGQEKISYRIAGDYECRKYAIHESMAQELRSYLKTTEKMKKNEIGTLFALEPHYRYFGTSTKYSSTYYSYANLNKCLKYFYHEIMGDKRTDLNRIRLGDTRHLAMANLIISGGSPVICKELAGHSDIDISSHYYSNISNLVECVTLERYRKSKGASTEIVGTPKYASTLPESRYRLSDGWCDAPLIKEGDTSECLKVADKQGQIGNCAYCIHYWPDEQGIRLKFLDEQTGKQEVDADCQYLMRMIETVRKGIGYEEDIGAALLRLQRSSNHYSKCLWEKYANVEEPSWQDRKN